DMTGAGAPRAHSEASREAKLTLFTLATAADGFLPGFCDVCGKHFSSSWPLLDGRRPSRPLASCVSATVMPGLDDKGVARLVEPREHDLAHVDGEAVAVVR
ncbi:MAG: hypothetical protein QOI42_2274, partial [Frankiaceae bacterium]|nr:hypothetical protein [Frankiaceae bacterium]